MGYAFFILTKRRAENLRAKEQSVAIHFNLKRGIDVMKKLHVLTEIAAFVALSVICSFIRVWEMPQGGSVALTMVPILLIAFRRGPAAGMITGGIYGLISMAIAGVIYHPMSILLDYVLAFALVGVAGFFRKNLPMVICGTTVGIAGRFLSSLISGAVLFAEYAPAGQNPWVYSLIYQATYLIPELFICIAVMTLLYTKGKRFFVV